MAARIRRPHQDEVRAKYRFYVYEIRDQFGNVLYVGKGSGRRMFVSAKAHGGEAIDVAWFVSEKDAYHYEVIRIRESNPSNNKHVGGNGARARAPSKTNRKTKFERTIDAIGTRAYAARLWLACAKSGLCDLSKLELVRQVAYG